MAAKLTAKTVKSLAAKSKRGADLKATDLSELDLDGISLCRAKLHDTSLNKTM